MIQGVLFDLDGVIVSTDEFHFQGWKRLADEEGIPFTREDNERCRGVSRMESLAIVLEKASRDYTEDEKVEMATRKNEYYRRFLENDLSPDDILPGVMTVLDALRERGVRLAIGSSSRNAPIILQKIKLEPYFDAVIDGNQIQHSKPDPEVFLLGTQALGLSPETCLVVEDAEAGVSAALNGGMKVLAVGFASNDPRAHLQAKDLTAVTVDAMLGV